MWQKAFPDNKVTLTRLLHLSGIGKKWGEVFEKIISDNAEQVSDLEKRLSSDVKKGLNIFPNPDMVFRALTYFEPSETKTVILGQDPYPSTENGIPQATGLAFSVPDNISIPSSLNNIYKNLVKFGHYKEMPKTGNLENWTKKHMILLNTSLTVIQGKKLSHEKIWQPITNKIIEYLSDNVKNLTFLVWGSNAQMTVHHNVDQEIHRVIISSHPSGLSCDKPMKSYPAFTSVDHFKGLF